MDYIGRMVMRPSVSGESESASLLCEPLPRCGSAFGKSRPCQLRRNDRVFFVARRQVLRRLFPAVYMDNNIDYFTISSET